MNKINNYNNNNKIENASNNDFLSLFGNQNSEFDDIELDYLDLIHFAQPTATETAPVTAAPAPALAPTQAPYYQVPLATHTTRYTPALSTSTSSSAAAAVVTRKLPEATTVANRNFLKSKMSDESRQNLWRIREKTVELEKERRAIQNRLESLRNEASSPISNNSNETINRILAELREQQRINEAALNMLHQRLSAADPSITQPSQLSMRSSLNNKNPYLTGSLPTVRNSSNSDFLNGFTSNTNDITLTPEDIRMMRLNYLQNGGHDQNVLHKFTEMEYNARFKETNRYLPPSLIDQNNINKLDSQSPTRLRLINEPKIQNEIIKNALNENTQLRPTTNPDILVRKRNLFNDNNNSNQANKNSRYKFSNSLSFSDNHQFYDVPVPLVSDILADDVIKRNKPINTNLDEKLKRIDSDNKRLQAELELLQEKYLNLNTGNAATFEILKRYNDPLPPINSNMNSNPNQNSNINQNLSLTPIPQIYSPNRIKYVPLQEQMPNLLSQSREPLNAANGLADQAFRSHSNFKADPLNAPSRLVRLKDLAPTPYDPVGGFVIFIDFITNLDPAYGCARVITCLHHPKSGLGEPSVLPIVNCDSYIENNVKTSVALISTKQPVPRCPPQQALTILIELQTAYKDTSDAKLKSCSWTKIPLFDSKNRLLSGRWKTPLKNLPIRSDVGLNSLASISDFGESDMYYRLVNLRDADEQTNAPISPSYASQYNPTSQFLESNGRSINKTNNNNNNNNNHKNTKEKTQYFNLIDQSNQFNSKNLSVKHEARELTFKKLIEDYPVDDLDHLLNRQNTNQSDEDINQSVEEPEIYKLYSNLRKQQNNKNKIKNNNNKEPSLDNKENILQKITESSRVESPLFLKRVDTQDLFNNNSLISSIEDNDNSMNRNKPAENANHKLKESPVVTNNQNHIISQDKNSVENSNSRSGAFKLKNKNSNDFTFRDYLLKQSLPNLTESHNESPQQKLADSRKFNSTSQINNSQKDKHEIIPKNSYKQMEQQEQQHFQQKQQQSQQHQQQKMKQQQQVIAFQNQKNEQNQIKNSNQRPSNIPVHQAKDSAWQSNFNKNTNNQFNNQSEPQQQQHSQPQAHQLKQPQKPSQNESLVPKSILKKTNYNSNNRESVQSTSLSSLSNYKKNQQIKNEQEKHKNQIPEPSVNKNSNNNLKNQKFIEQNQQQKNFPNQQNKTSNIPINNNKNQNFTNNKKFQNDHDNNNNEHLNKDKNIKPQQNSVHTIKTLPENSKNLNNNKQTNSLNQNLNKKQSTINNKK